MRPPRLLVQSESLGPRRKNGSMLPKRRPSEGSRPRGRKPRRTLSNAQRRNLLACAAAERPRSPRRPRAPAPRPKPTRRRNCSLSARGSRRMRSDVSRLQSPRPPKPKPQRRARWHERTRCSHPRPRPWRKPRPTVRPRRSCRRRRRASWPRPMLRASAQSRRKRAPQNSGRHRRRLCSRHAPRRSRSEVSPAVVHLRGSPMRRNREMRLWPVRPQRPRSLVRWSVRLRTPGRLGIPRAPTRPRPRLNSRRWRRSEIRSSLSSRPATPNSLRCSGRSMRRRRRSATH